MAIMEPNLVWEDPPEPKRGQGRRSPFVEAIVAKLVSNPGKWGHFTADSRNSAMSTAQTLKRHGCEVKTRTSDAGKIVVYAKAPAINGAE